MDLLQNPFHILNATPRDSRHRIMELAEKQSLFQDADQCIDARVTLMHPLKRISAEVAWLPGVAPERVDAALKQLDSPTLNLLDINELTPIAQVNLLAAGLSRLPYLSSYNFVKWILKMTKAFEDITSEEVYRILNEARKESGFPGITDLSSVEEKIRNQRNHYRQIIKVALENLSTKERASAVTLAIETTTGNSEYPLTNSDEDLVASYEVDIQS